MRNSDGTFKEGVSGNPEGKPKGAISTKTKEWHSWGDYVVGENMPLYVQNLNEMLKSADERIQQEGMKRYEAIIEYFKPKLSRTEFSGEIQEKSSIDPSKYTKEELMQLKQLIKKGKNAEQG